MGKTEKPSSYEAFTSQSKQAFFELLSHTSSNTCVYIEKDDDVSVEGDGIFELIQVKSATSEKNHPLGDNAKDLWKTLCIWIDKVRENGQHNPYTGFKYSVTSKNDIRIGEIAHRFHEAIGSAEVEEAYEYARQRFRTTPTNVDEKSKFFNRNNKGAALIVIKCFSYETHQGFINELRTLFEESNAYPDKMINHLFGIMFGWVVKRSTTDTEEGKPASLSRSEYRNHLASELNRLKTDPLMVSVSVPSRDDLIAEYLKCPTYLKQMRIIGLGDGFNEGSRELKAVTDFLRSSSQITKWSEEGCITSEGLTSYSEDLCDNWADQRDLIGLDEAKEPIKFGVELYLNCRTTSRDFQLQGMHAPWFVAKGKLHDLASYPSDSPRIGWHPNYINELKLYLERESGLDGGV